MTGKSWFISQNGKEIFLLSIIPTKPPTQWISEALCPGIQQPRHEAGHSALVCCECCVLSGRGLCDGLITRPGESYRLVLSLRMHGDVSPLPHMP